MDRKIHLVKFRVPILPGKLPGNRVIVDPVDHRLLLKLGQTLDHRVDNILHPVSIKTYCRWFREKWWGQTPGRVGGPASAACLRSFVRAGGLILLDLAQQND